MLCLILPDSIQFFLIFFMHVNLWILVPIYRPGLGCPQLPSYGANLRNRFFVVSKITHISPQIHHHSHTKLFNQSQGPEPKISLELLPIYDIDDDVSNDANGGSSRDVL